MEATGGAGLMGIKIGSDSGRVVKSGEFWGRGAKGRPTSDQTDALTPARS